jgi:tripartite-type tricarboxylate transporter receptor subunit TctC
MRQHCLISGRCALLFGALSAPAHCGNYPDKPIRLIAPEFGGASDLVARLIAQRGILGQQAVVDNRNPLVGIDIAAKAPPDGYTLLMSGSSLWTVPLLQKVSFNPSSDFAPITLAVNSPSVLVAHPTVAAGSVKELIALAKAKPGSLNYASSGNGSLSHLAAELFKSMAAINIVQVNYKGSGPALNDLIAGQVQLMLPSVGATMPHVKSGRLKALAVASAQPSALAPGLPTISASGLPGYEAGTAATLFAPASTPRAVVAAINGDVVHLLEALDTGKKLLNAGVEVVASSPEQLAARIRSEMAKLGKVIKDAGIRAE